VITDILAHSLLNLVVDDGANLVNAGHANITVRDGRGAVVLVDGHMDILVDGLADILIGGLAGVLVDSDVLAAHGCWADRRDRILVDTRELHEQLASHQASRETHDLTC
jgi:hypothetical protein